MCAYVVRELTAHDELLQEAVHGRGVPGLDALGFEGAALGGGNPSLP